MTDRPMIFSEPMIKALLAGTKTQTRRVMKPQPDDGGDDIDALVVTDQIKAPCQPGDRYWVREACRADELPDSGWDGVRYLADDAFIQIENSPEASDAWSEMFHYRRKRGANVSSIHMPRWASRMTLVVTDVRPGRVQDISEEDARAEGAKPWTGALQCYRTDFYRIWDEIHGTGAWHRNPWVWRIAFEPHACNIDRMEEDR